MSDNVLGCFAVAFRLGCRPGPLQFLLCLFGRLRQGGHEFGPEDQPAQRPSLPTHNPSPVVMRGVVSSPELTYLHNGRDERLTEKGGRVVNELF
jgi:hypothetical protein